MAFYVRVDEARFESTAYTRGPWDIGSQHAGPPAALLGRAVAGSARDGMRAVRLTYDIARPVPVAPLEVTTRVVRQGRSTAIVEAAIEPYMRVSALLMRAQEGAAPEVVDPARVKLADAVPKEFLPVDYEQAYHTAMDARFVRGAFLERGPGTAWMRMRMPLVEGEPVDPLTRVLVAADSGNGVSNVLDFARHVFVNSDLTVNLHRYPIGEWVCLEAQTQIDGDGIGVAASVLHDERGPIGYATQSLFVNARSSHMAA